MSASHFDLPGRVDFTRAPSVLSLIGNPPADQDPRPEDTPRSPAGAWQDEAWALIGTYATALRVLSEAGYGQDSLAYGDYVTATLRLDRFLSGLPVPE